MKRDNLQENITTNINRNGGRQGTTCTIARCIHVSFFLCASPVERHIRTFCSHFFPFSSLFSYLATHSFIFFRFFSTFWTHFDAILFWYSGEHFQRRYPSPIASVWKRKRFFRDSFPDSWQFQKIFSSGMIL